MESLNDWIQWVAPVVTAAATCLIAYYAYVTIREGKRDRKKDTLEKMLENLYSPLYAILERARFESNQDRKLVRGMSSETLPRDYAIADKELRQIHRIIERFGHYFEPDELLKLKRDLQEYELAIPPYEVRENGTRIIRTWYRYHNNAIDPHLDYIREKVKQLRQQLQALSH